MKRTALAAVLCLAMSPLASEEFGRLNPEEGGLSRLAENLAAHPERAGTLCWVAYETQKGGRDLAPEAFQAMLTCAENGNAPSMIMLSHAYENGFGTDSDPELSTYWVQQAALSGYSMGAYHYGVALLNGYGTPRDLTEAVRWLRVAADDGIEDAVTELEKLGKA
ncbi:MAG: hypothetical protein NXH97_12950 [Rhodobacteraceae bacterium]|nr:hypothetical protein [Paracoccaceae bacterium]